MKQRLSILIVSLLVMLMGCNKPKETDMYAGADFYPLVKGNYVIYDVKKIVYDVTGKVDTISYQIKEVIGDTVSSPNSETPFSYKVLRYSRDTTFSKTWNLDSAWQIWKTPKTLVKNENGEEFIKLSFPIKNNQKWNGNAYNSRESNLYETRNLGDHVTLNNKFYDNIVVVMQSDSLPLNKVNRDFRVEYYSQNIGMIYKEWQYYIYDQSQFGKYKIESGARYIQTIVTYGKE